MFWSIALFCTLTFSPERFRSFQDEYIYEQAVIVDRALDQPIPPAPPSPPDEVYIPPQGKLNHVALVIRNHSGLDASRLFVVGKGQTLEATNAYFLQPNLETGVCQLVSSATHNSADSDISVRLSHLPKVGTNEYLIYVPQMISGRFYLSVDTPLYMKTGLSGGISTIDDPSQTTVQDPNYYTLYQNFEFTLDVNYDLFANVTNVDYVALPLTLGSYTYPTGQLYPTLDNLTVVGFPETSSRSSILNQIQAGLVGSGIASDWSTLSIPFYADPYTNSDPQTTLRILAAKLSIALSGSRPFQGAPPVSFFSSVYLQDSTKGPAPSKSYMQLLHDHYKNKKMAITIFPASNPTANYVMTSSLTSENLDFKLHREAGKAPSTISVDLSKLTTSALLHGAIGEWVSNGAISPAAADPWQTEIAKTLSALFTAGFLPLPSFVSQPVIVNDSFFDPYRGFYFKNPTGFTQNGPWYNLYDKVIHPLYIQTGGIGLGYAYDFDDLLGIAGLLHVNVQTNGVLNPARPYTLLTVGPIDTIIPNPKVDFGPYDLVFESLTPGSDGVDIIYSTSPSDPPSIVQAVPFGGPQSTISGLQNYFYVKRYLDPGNTTFETYIVYPKYQLVLPTTNRYNSEDANLMNGIAFQSHSTSTSIHVAFSFH
jgi:hypothetical protein